MPFEDSLAEARLVLTDDLVRDALRAKDNRARKEARKRRKAATRTTPARKANERI
jgi:ribosome maturation factor RimP